MITREADYAIRAVLELSSGATSRSAVDLARATQVPYPFLRRVLAKLTAARLVQSLRGRAGGVRLARSAAAISLLDVTRAIDPSTITLNSCLRDGGTCERMCQCAAHEPLDRLQQELWRALDAITFASLVKPDHVVTKTKKTTRRET